MVGEERKNVLGSLSLLVAIMRPERPEGIDAFVLPIDPEQVLEPLIDERIAFHVEVQVAIGWPRQACQPEAWLNGAKLELWGPTAAPCMLQSRLHAQLSERLGSKLANFAFVHG